MTDENLKPNETPVAETVEPVEETKEETPEEVKTEETTEVPEEPAEEPKKEETTEAETTTEEPKEEAPGEETTVEETPEKAPTEEPVEKDKKEEVLEESLSVIKEVRTELVNAYKTHKDMSVQTEQLNSEIESLKKEKEDAVKTIETLNSELGTFKERETEALQQAYNKRLEQLSNNFKVLGQERSIEQLSGLGEEVITEFEAITTLALSNRQEEKLSTLTVPTQAMATKKPEETLSDEKKEPAGTKEFNFESLCNALTGQQNVDGQYTKKIINM